MNKDKQTIRIIKRGETSEIDASQVQYFQSSDQYTMVYHDDGVACISDTLISLEKRFGDQFLRVHRNTLIDPKSLTKMYRRGRYDYIRLQGIDAEIRVSKRHFANVQQVYQNTIRERLDRRWSATQQHNQHR